MFLTSFQQLPGPPSRRANTGRARVKVFSSITPASTSTTPSPTQSTLQSRLSSEVSTSISDPDDYVDKPAPKSVTSARMKLKFSSQNNQSLESENRRSSGRVRKPTAKAQALSVENTSPSQILDTIVIGGSPPETSPSPAEKQPTTPSPGKSISNAISTEIEIPETPVQVVNGSTPPTKTAGDDAQDVQSAPPDNLLDSPSRRHSQRERKPTAKVLETSPPNNQKRSAPEHQDAPQRKSARISYSGPRVPSKLRYSVSSTSTEAESPKTKEDAEPLTETKSRVVVLNVPRLAELLTANEAKESPESRVKLTPRRRTRRSRNQEKTNHTIPKQSTTTVTQHAKQPPCSLSCLPESSRLLAMAEIASMMPDSDDEDGDVVPGSALDWRVYAAQMCQCSNLRNANTSRTNSIELQRALEPNPLSKGAQFAPIELSPTPEPDMLTTPVNTILIGKESDRVKELFASVATNSAMANPDPFLSSPMNTRPQPRILRRSLPNKSRSERLGINGGVANSSPQQSSFSTPLKRSFEDRLRTDQMAMSEIRKKAASKGIRWTFNMSFDDIQGLLMDLEAQEEEGVNRYKRARTINSGFGMLRPSRG